MIESRQRIYKAVFTDGSVRESTGENVTVIFFRMLNFMLTLHKDIRVDYIIDEKGAKIYSDFLWDFTFVEREKAYNTGSPKLVSLGKVNELLLEYVRHIGGSEDFAQRWLDRQVIE